MSSNPIIESITCPITGTIMKDPVQGNDGQTYERLAITEWLTKHQASSPITKDYMTVSDLKVNASIRYLCDKYHAGELGINNSEDMDTSNDNKSNLKSTEHPKINNSVFKNSTISSNDPTKFMVKLSVEDLIDKGVLSHDVIVVIDRSGSMEADVQAKDENGNTLEDGLSQQDIVNHSAKMVAKTLGLNSNNRLAVIAFDNRIETVFSLMPMTEMNCSRVISQIDDIKPRNQTDIWRALESAINMLSDRNDKSRNPHIILLTDGIPNISPARGEVTTLENKMKTLNFYPPIYAFGFGYNLKPDLLYGISKISGGAVGHIPDGGMIATVFSNFISTIMCTVAYNMKLTIELDDELMDVPHIHGDFKNELFGSGREGGVKEIVINIGTIQIGQSRDIIVSNIVSNIVSKILKYTYTYQIADTCYEVVEDTMEFGDEWHMDPNITRFFLVEKIREAIKLKKSDQSAMNLYIQMVEHFNDIDITTEGAWGTLMYETLTSQVRLSLSDLPKHASYFKRWGMWYLDQLSFALCHQIKPNFKDVACYFGGKLFIEIVDYASDQFDSLPPPVPSNVSGVNYGFNSGSQYRSLGSIPVGSTPPPSQIQMSTYNSQSGPCFDGNCLITMASGSKKMVSELVKGDDVWCLYNPYNTNSTVLGKVVCILKTVIVGGMGEMVSFENGLKITPWHPIIDESKKWLTEYDSTIDIDISNWRFPFDMKNTSTYCGICEQTEVYSILLDNWHTCQINDTWCICLGHNYTQGILKHEYFGSQKVVDDMSSMRGWDKGLIVINSNDISRDMESGIICEINQFDEEDNFTPIAAPGTQFEAKRCKVEGNGVGAGGETPIISDKVLDASLMELSKQTQNTEADNFFGNRLL